MALKAHDVFVFGALAAVAGYFIWTRQPNQDALSRLGLVPVTAAHAPHLTCSGGPCDGISRGQLCPGCPQQYPNGPTVCGCASLDAMKPTGAIW